MARLLGKQRRRPRRGALPSALVGLVTFSFVLLAFGTVAYTAALPSLVEAAEHSGEGGLFYGVLQHVLSAESISGAADASDGGASDAPGNDDGAFGSKGSSNPAGSPLGSIALGGGFLQDLVVQSSGGALKPPAQAEPEGQKPQGPSGNPGGQSGSSGPEAAGDAAPSPDETPDDPKPTPEQEQAVHDALLPYANRIDGYIAKVNTVTSDFGAHCYADEGTRRRCHAAAGVLSNELLNEYLGVRDRVPDIAHNSAYLGAHGDLIRMYRLLIEYVELIRSAWNANLSMVDPSADPDVFMNIIRAEENEQGVNKQLAEFRSVYEGFVL